MILIHGLPDNLPDNRDGLFTPAWINDKTLAGMCMLEGVHRGGGSVRRGSGQPH